MSETKAMVEKKIVFPKSLKAGKEITELTTIKKANLTSTEKFFKMKIFTNIFHRI